VKNKNPVTCPLTSILTSKIEYQQEEHFKLIGTENVVIIEIGKNSIVNSNKQIKL